MNHAPRPAPALDGTLDDLLGEEAWLERFVKSLVGPDEAEDVIQSTWLLALQSPPRHRGALRVWLRRVAHNLIRQHWHGKRRQKERRNLYMHF